MNRTTRVNVIGIIYSKFLFFFRNVSENMKPTNGVHNQYKIDIFMVETCKLHQRCYAQATISPKWLFMQNSSDYIFQARSNFPTFKEHTWYQQLILSGGEPTPSCRKYRRTECCCIRYVLYY